MQDHEPASTTVAIQPAHGTGVDRWARAANIATALGLLFTGASACLALFSYQSELETKRAEKTIEYISLWENGGSQKSYRYIYKKWAEFIAKVPAAQIAYADSDADAKAKIIRNFYAESRHDEQWKSAVEETAYFFNRLGLCVKANLCSRTVAHVFFGGVITPYVGIFGAYIDDKKNDISGSTDIIRLPME